MFYKRNHGPIPILPDPSTYNVMVTGAVSNVLSLSLDFLKSLPKYTVVATLMCAGNRRTEMSRRRKVRGVGWGAAAIGTAAWGGAKLSDVLKLAGVDNYSDVTLQNGRHVEFVSVDFCKEENGGPYKASIPLLHATTPEAEVLLAYEMNGKVLNRDHGYPLRVVIPGVIGARSVKWIESIIVSEIECQGFFQQKDYKMFPPRVDWDNIDWQSRRPLMDFPVQSVICEPKDGVVLKHGDTVDLSGYAVAGGGRGIERVDISVDNGKSWVEARRLPKLQADANSDSPRPDWAWTLWELKNVTVETPCTVIVKAVDTAANVQPADIDDIWNLRGVLNNSWHRIRIEAPSRAKL
jgi:sulfite oxidase